MAAPKIIVLGSLTGQLEPAIKKLATLHSKNSFSLALLTGDLFAPETDEEAVTALLEGKLEIPLPTYFSVANHPLPTRIAAKVEADEEICPNLHFLGKRSITKTSEGIRIVCLGGQVDPDIISGQSMEQHLPFHTSADAKALRGANGADILLTSLWPTGIWNGSNVSLDPAQQASLASTEAVAELCAALRPRYHLTTSPGPFFYEREPFVTTPEKAGDLPVVTRFISLAPFGTPKAKFMYAFSLNKSDTAIPAGVTSSPFVSKSKKRDRHDGGNERNGRWQRDDAHHGRRNKRRRASPPPGPDRCYFCLSNPNISTHMCCSIGDDAYITTAKGPLPTSTTFAEQGMQFPGHLLIIPLPHSPTIPSMGSVTDPDSDAVKTYKEMTRFREAIQAMVSSVSSHKLGLVTWEISRERNIHLIWQCLAAPADLIQKDLVTAAFKVEAENDKYPDFKIQDLSLADQPTYGDFFRVWVWADNGEDLIKGKSLIMPLPSDLRFDLQFPRRVMAKLLGLEGRLVWQDCAQTDDEETKDVELFREAFKPWDFTLEGP
ncbi:hypothetical protein S40293_05829 [Stachybotrys chartarum IBT 40293]|nr:hypothetical protein S40293_05829 [Stachybotrys chartarum IBT 40293]